MALQVTIRPRPGIESAITGICTSPLAATQHRPRLLAPARQLVRRRDQRLLPRRVFNPDRARESSFGYRSPVIKNPFRRKLQTRHPAIRLAYGTAGRQFVCSDHPGLSESAVGEVCRLKKWQTRYPAIRVVYGAAGHQFACSDHPGLSESAAGKVCI